MKRITVFCGSSPGFDDQFMRQAYRLGQYLAEQRLGLVYGGARVGLMGAVADGALAEGGEVIGVIPRFLRTKEIAHEGLTELILTGSMHERKTKMNEISDGVIALPGGFGTLEEFFEMLTWAQLGLHRKPIGLLNVGGFYDPLLQMAQTMVDKGFLNTTNQQMVLAASGIEELLNRMRDYRAPEVPKWLNKDEV
jgi:uncharacterized protein (TIGR00730 family)